jgi:hypothetical protein
MLGAKRPTLCTQHESWSCQANASLLCETAETLGIVWIYRERVETSGEEEDPNTKWKDSVRRAGRGGTGGIEGPIHSNRSKTPQAAKKEGLSMKLLDSYRRTTTSCFS